MRTFSGQGNTKVNLTYLFYLLDLQISKYHSQYDDRNNTNTD